jgi:hypothetical protein
MSAHTPGPWQACGCGHCGLVWSKPADWCVASMGGGPHDEQGTMPNETRLANARLVAAAPDLLEACEIAKVELELENTPADLARILFGVRAALIKARGGK